MHLQLNRLNQKKDLELLIGQILRLDHTSLTRLPYAGKYSRAQPVSSPNAAPAPATSATINGLNIAPIVKTTAIPGAGKKTVAYAIKESRKIPG
jgi:hypothetical protein